MVDQGTKIIKQPLQILNRSDLPSNFLKLPTNIFMMFFICLVLEELFRVEGLALSFDHVEVVLKQGDPMS